MSTRPPQRILLAEDNHVSQRLAVGLLSRHGHHVTVAATGTEAVDACRAARFDLVLMDVQMPGMNGLDAARAIRQMEAGTNRRVPILALTAASTDERDACMAAGMDGYIPKPIDPDTLFAAIDDRCAGAPATAVAIDPSAGAVDTAALRLLLDNDDAVVGEIASVFLRETPALLQALQHAVERRDAAGVASNAHGLKGSASAVMARELADVASTLEQAGYAGRVADFDAVLARLQHEVARANRDLDALAAAAAINR